MKQAETPLVDGYFRMTSIHHPEGEREDSVLEAANALFGVRYLYPYQRLVVANVLDATGFGSESAAEEPCEFKEAASDVTAEPDRLRQIVLLPTGYGKSLCFQLPAALIDGVTLVTFPLRSLMSDQERRIRERGLPCVVLRGGMERPEKEAAFDQIRSGRVRMVLANPEILRTDSVLSLLRTVGVKHAVIDEAHCVAEWGEDFRPAYGDLGDILHSLFPVATTAFTATASPRILEKVSEVLFKDEPYRVIAGNPDRPNIHYSCVSTLSRPHTLVRLARELPRPLLIFCSSRPGTEITAEMLMERLQTRDVRFYHAGMSKTERNAVESWFLPSENGILIATCAFGMGIDKPDIRAVVHADPPPSVESYLQESGRAGRDGKPSRAVLVCHPDDWRRLNRIQDAIRKDRQRAILIYGQDGSRCRRERLLDLLGAAADSCSGCDCCDGTAVSEPEGWRETMEFVRSNSGRFTVSEASRRLAGLGAPCACGGALSGWKAEDVREAIETTRRHGDIRVPLRGPWKGRVRKRPHRDRFLGNAGKLKSIVEA